MHTSKPIGEYVICDRLGNIVYCNKDDSLDKLKMLASTYKSPIGGELSIQRIINTEIIKVFEK